MNQFNLKQSIGDSVVEYPSLVKLFMMYHIDFCCGGQRTVEEALNIDANNPKEVIDAIQNAVEKHHEAEASASEYGKMNKPLLIDEIVKTHHHYLKEEMPVISELLFKLLRVHSQKHPELKDLHRIFNELRIALEAHLVSEEVELFPLILEGKLEEAKILEAIIDDHDEAGVILYKMLEITDHFSLPEDACQTYKICYNKLESFVADMFMHVHKENNVLFK